MTTCPNVDQWLAVSCTIRPVTQDAETVVNKASIKEAEPVIFEEKGMMSSKVPIIMTLR